jgi:hypothetical protein
VRSDWRDLAVVITALLAGLRAEDLRQADVGDIRTTDGGAGVIYVNSCSKASAAGQPDAVEAEVSLYGDGVVVVVVVQHAGLVPVSQRSDDEIDWGKPVVPGSGKLTLRVDGAALYFRVDVQDWQRHQLAQQLVVISGAACRISSFKQERKADTEQTLFDSVGDFVCPLLLQRR